MKPSIHAATPNDAADLLAIYRPYITQTAITFEVEPPSVKEFRERIQGIVGHYPWIVARDQDGTALGYAYAWAYKQRAAYDWSAETSIYIRQDMRGQGLGRILYSSLEEVLVLQGFRNALASISCTDRDIDPFLTNGSIRFHQRMGFREVGILHDCGFKLGRWYSMLIMEKMIGSHDEAPRAITPFPEIELPW